MIRLVSVIGHGVKLIPHFINHYVNMVDEINFVIYESPKTLGFKDDMLKQIDPILIKNGKVKIIKEVYHEQFDWNEVTRLYNEIKLTYPDDWWIVSDIDEFQVYPKKDLKVFISECDENGWELIRGGFLDRIGENGEFSELLSDIDIFKQYPNIGFFRYPMSGACPNKICLMKGYIELTAGQHYAKIDGHTTWRWQGWNHPLIAPYNEMSVQVHHFKWDSTSISRVREIGLLGNPNSFPMEYKRMYIGLKESKFKIDINNPKFMFEKTDSRLFWGYKQWNKLLNKIVAI
jgi:hypothetical protein